MFTINSQIDYLCSLVLLKGKWITPHLNCLFLFCLLIFSLNSVDNSLFFPLQILKQTFKPILLVSSSFHLHNTYTGRCYDLCKGACRRILTKGKNIQIIRRIKKQKKADMTLTPSYNLSFSTGKKGRIFYLLLEDTWITCLCYSHGQC